MTEQAASPPTRVRIAQVLAFVGLVTALVGGLGPSERVRTTYSWPPEELPSAEPERLWYTPLLLIRHRPESISADLPCTASPTVAPARRSASVLATARYPARAGGLAITQVDGRLVIAIGERTLGRLPLAAGAPLDGACERRLSIGGGAWSVEEGGEATTAGSVDETPVVYGLFSELDLRSRPQLSVDVTTAPHATRTTTSQAVAWIIAAAAITAALLLLVAHRRPRLAAFRHSVRAATMQAHPVDAVVGASLLAWWVLAPTLGDDGWVAAREEMFATSRGFSHYYIALGTNLPVDYWVEWLQHWLVQSTSALVLWRLPALACLAITWVLCRWIAHRLLAATAGQSNVVLWALASAFLVGALSWGMTLRPEPTTALLVTAVLACTVRFLERGTAAPLAATAVLVPLALTAHPAGIVALAPVLACAGKLLEFVRARPAVASTIVAAGVASLALLATVGADLEQRRADAQATVEYSHSVAWRYELIRYTSLADVASLRRSSVTLIALALAAYALWGRSRRRGLLDFPAIALALSLVLLIATPSKQTWHFGALMGLAAVAVACETARLRHRASESRRLEAQPLIVLAGVVLAIAWSWDPRNALGPLDLRTLDWTLAFESRLDLSTLASALPFALVVALGLNEVARRGRSRLPTVPWRAVMWTASLLALPLVVFTVAVLAIDAVRTDAWTLTRQNLGALRGDAGCGIADGLLVAIPESARPLSGARPDTGPTQPAWVPPPPAEGIPRFALGPEAGGRASSPWFPVGSPSFGFFIAGAPTAGDLELQWGRVRRNGIESISSDAISPSSGQESESVLPQWRLVAAGELPPRPQDADLVRIAVRSERVPGPAVAVTVPVTYDRELLAPRFTNASSRTYVAPDVLAFFPCVRLPLLSNGIVEVPDHLVMTREITLVQLGEGTSPFLGVLDVFPLRRLPLADSRNPPRGAVAVFAVDTRIAGAVEAPPSKTTWGS